LTFTTIIILVVISALSLYWSSVFRRSVHATAVSYVSVIVLTVVTMIVFSVAQAISGGRGWFLTHLYIKAPLYANPGFFMLMAFSTPRGLYPHWFACLAVFLTIGGLSVLLTIRNIRRSGNVV